MVQQPLRRPVYGSKDLARFYPDLPAGIVGYMFLQPELVPVPLRQQQPERVVGGPHPYRWEWTEADNGEYGWMKDTAIGSETDTLRPAGSAPLRNAPPSTARRTRRGRGPPCRGGTAGLRRHAAVMGACVSLRTRRHPGRPSRPPGQRVPADPRERREDAADRGPHPAVGPPAGAPAVVGLDGGPARPSTNRSRSRTSRRSSRCPAPAASPANRPPPPTRRRPWSRP